MNRPSPRVVADRVVADLGVVVADRARAAANPKAENPPVALVVGAAAGHPAAKAVAAARPRKAGRVTANTKFWCLNQAPVGCAFCAPSGGIVRMVRKMHTLPDFTL